ncbi:MAG TPA: M20/M25/M40 family metallo-hydrolase [Verrucomicrobiales bacterium]|nr:M20/M25/M40 family metallo-hydrolase [Verrucomicrobiales bacterium]
MTHSPRFTAVELQKASAFLQQLIQFDTSNPPGDEASAIAFIAERCRSLGLEPEIVGAYEERPNLVARLAADPAKRTGRPLILSCHIDVVPADPARWTHPPFSGHDDGTCIWGRGAIDMKGFATMALTALGKLISERVPINRDVIFVAVSDEEAGTRLGSKWLVEERPDLLGDDPEYVINEVGGFTVHQKGHRFYPVQVAEKGVAWLSLSIEGTPGHSSLPSADNAVSKLARAIEAIAAAKLPWHAGPEAMNFISGFAKPQGWLARKIAPLLAHSVIGPLLLPLAIKDPSRRASLEAILRNTANPTCLHGSESINMLPGSASVDIDGRLAPGQTANDLIRELEAVIRPVLGNDFDLYVLQESEAVSFSADTPLYREIERTLRSADPEGHVIPSIIPGFTDSRNYARLGAQCYGFYPLQLPPDLDFASLFHGDNERIPIAGFHWGIETLTELLIQFLTNDSIKTGR